jgi:hypothetical protein
MQNDFFEMLIDMAKIMLEVKGIQIPDGKKIWIEGPDITERDNATLALALGRAYPHLSDLLDRDGIDDKEFLRLVYKTFAETWDEDKTPKIKRKPLVKGGGTQTPASPTPTDPASHKPADKQE